MHHVFDRGGVQRFRVVRLCVVSLIPACAGASEFLPMAAAGVTYSDNISRAEPAKADTMYGVEAGLRYLNTTSRWNADIDVRGTHMEFVDHTYPSQSLGWGIANFGISILPRTLSWELEDNYGQAATDPFGAIQPTGRQNINYLTTGPNLTLPFGGTSHVDVQGRYSKVDYSDTSTLDNQRYSVTGALVHELTSIRTLAINLYDQRAEFTHPELFRNYDLRSAYLTLISAPRRSRYELDAGITEVDDGLTTHRGTLLSTGITHQLTESDSIQLYGRRGFADSADTFRFQQAGGSTDPFLIGTNVQVRADPYTETRADVSLTSLNPRATVTLAGYWAREEYVNNSLFNRTLYGVSANVAYVLTPEVRLDGLVTYERDTFAGGLEGNKDLAISLMATRRITDALNLNFRAERYNRRSSLTPFTENRAVISLTYAPQPRARNNPRLAPTFLDRAHGINSRPTTVPATHTP